MEAKVKQSPIKNKWIVLFLLAVAAGEIYQLAYLRYAYYDAMIHTLGYTNTQFGNLMSMFGVGAVICYLLGGALADRLPAKWLLSSGQILTGLGGLLFATFPSYPIAIMINFYWAFTSCLIFWPTLMGYIREMGSDSEQGRLYGMLEGMRGIAVTVIGLGVIALFNRAPTEAAGLRTVILTYTAINIVCGVVTYFIIPYKPKVRVASDGTKVSFRNNLVRTIKLPQVWLVTGTIFFTCICFDCLGYATPYMTACMGVSATLAAVVAVFRTWGIQFVGGTAGGFIADKVGSISKTLAGGFAIITAGFVAMILMPANSSWAIPATILMLTFGIAIFVNRGIYFAAMSEAKVPMELNGTVSGFASAVGFLPDAFIYTVIGAIIDARPGAVGYHGVFGLAAVSGALGLVCAAALYKICKKEAAKAAAA